MMDTIDHARSVRDVCKKKRENVGILKKQGGGSTQIPHPSFTVFNMGDPPTINISKVLKCKINHNFFSSQTWGSQTGGRGRGGPRHGKNSHIFPFFLQTSLTSSGWQTPTDPRNLCSCVLSETGPLIF